MARLLAVLVLLSAHCMALTALAGMAAAPFLADRYLRMEGSAVLGRPVSLDGLRFNPFTFEVRAEGFSVGDGSGGTLAGFSLLDVDLDPLMLLKKQAAVSRFILKEPSLNLSRDAEGRWNIQDLLDKAGLELDPADHDPVRLGFSIQGVRVSGGSFVLDDALAGRRQEVTGVAFSLDSAVSGRPGLGDLFTSSGRVNGAPMALTVKADLADLAGQGFRAEARAELSDVFLANYTPYVLPFKKALDVRLDKAVVTATLALPGKGAPDGPSLECGTEVSGIVVRDGDEVVATIPSLTAGEVRLAADGSVSVGKVELSGPSVRVSRNKTGIVGIIDLLEPESGPDSRGKSSAGPDSPAAALPAVTVGSVRVSGGRADLYDQGLDMSLVLERIEAELKDLDPLAGRFGALEVTAASDSFASLEASCSGSYAPVALTGKAILAGVDLAKPLPSLKRLLPRLWVDGTGTFTADFTLRDKGGLLTPSVTGDMRLEKFRMLAEGQSLPVITAGRVEVERLGYDGESASLGVGSVTLTKGAAALERDIKGDFPARFAFVPPNLHQSGTKADVWAATVARVSLKGFGLTYVDKTTKAKADAYVDDLSVTDFASGLDRPFSLSAKGTLLGSAPFEVSGKVRPDDLSFSLDVRVKGVPIGQMADIMPEKPAVSGSGLASLSGRLDASLGSGGLKASFQGDAGVSLIKFIREGRTRPWASATGVEVKGLSATLAPLSVSAKSVVVDEPWARVLVDENGKPRLPGLDLGKAESPKAEPAAPEPSYRFDTVEVRRGWLEIVARGFEPPLDWLLSGIEGTFTGVRPGQPAAFSLSMVTGHTGSLKAEGLAGWSSGTPLLDFKAALSNLDLGELSPVSRRFTGFPILRGMLGLKLDYKATPKTLDLKNNIVVTGIKLGDKQPGPDTRDVPLDLAVSLLTDSRGIIDLDIPVSGDPSAAKADLKDVISTAVSGAFVKVLSSPLAVLGAVSQRGQTVYLPFEPGKAELTPEARKSLDAMGKAMKDRPGLSMEVAAFVDQAGEAEAFGKVLDDPGEAGPGRRFFIRRRSAPGQAGQASQVSQEEAGQPSARNWLRLARMRQNAVLDYLAAKGDIPRDRVFPLAVTTGHMAPPDAPGQPAHRAELRLHW